MLRKFFLTKILRRKYHRTGKCLMCGSCCGRIYVKHYKHLINDEKEFERLRHLHGFYAGLTVAGKDDTGLFFKCEHFDGETKKCKIHRTRPAVCRRYPQEELFSLGGSLCGDCGYKMEPIVSFKEVLGKIQSGKSV